MPQPPPSDPDDRLVRVVWGTATGPTRLAAYDAALREAGVHNYNLVAVSSIIPPDTRVETPGTAPDLGPPGHRLTVVEARATPPGPTRATAGLGWTTGDGPGVLYEAAGEIDTDTARTEIERGLEAAQALREWPTVPVETRVVSTPVSDGEHGAAVALAVFGDGAPVFSA